MVDQAAIAIPPHAYAISRDYDARFTDAVVVALFLDSEFFMFAQAAQRFAVRSNGAQWLMYCVHVITKFSLRYDRSRTSIPIADFVGMRDAEHHN